MIVAGAELIDGILVKYYYGKVLEKSANCRNA